MAHRQTVNNNYVPFSGTISAGQNSVAVAHGMTGTPRAASVSGTNDFAKTGGIGINARSATHITVGFPEGVTQGGDATFEGIAII